jgi:hypothetical protein
VDFVAIHGLNGHREKTWTWPDKKDGNCWLKARLHGRVPGCRVFTFGYPSEMFFSTSTATVRDYARMLLEFLYGETEEEVRMYLAAQPLLSDTD